MIGDGDEIGEREGEVGTFPPSSQSTALGVGEEQLAMADVEAMAPQRLGEHDEETHAARIGAEIVNGSGSETRKPEPMIEAGG